MTPLVGYSVFVGWWYSTDVSVLEAVGTTFDGDDFGVVGESVDHGGSDRIVDEGFALSPQGLVAGDDDGGSLAPGWDELEE